MINYMTEENTNNLTKRERTDLKREEKQKEHERSVKIKQMKSWLPWGILLGLIVGGVYWASSAAQTANENRPGEAVTIMNADHIAPGGEPQTYNSNPPTSGPHAGPAPWGFNAEEIPDINAIHNIEHGGIWISYKNLDDDAIATLGEIARANSASLIVGPREANDTNIAVASWGRLMKLDAVDEERINEFIRQNKNKSPEPLAR
jgi:hypothetical protein